MSNTQVIPTFKVVLIGDGSVGKTTFVRRHKTGGFEEKYIPTVGVEVHPLKFHTNKGPVCLNIWDCAGQEKYGGLRDGYYIGMDAAIVMFSLTSEKSFDSTKNWIQDIRRVNETAPITLVGNKVDLFHEDENANIDRIRSVARECNVHYYPVSAKRSYNFEKPFLYLIRRLTGDDTIHFVDIPRQAVPNTLTRDPVREQHLLLEKGIRRNRREKLMRIIRDALDEIDLLNEEEQEE